MQVGQGKFQDKQVLLDLVRALVQVEDRKARGIGSQNFHYGSTLSNFAHTCAIISPELYRTLAKDMPLPALRTLACVHTNPRYTSIHTDSAAVRSRHRAKMPRFPIEIGERSFVLAREYIDKLGYGTGPVALSCDDTKLHAAWRTYFDSEADLHFLVGGTGPPLAIANIDELNDILSRRTDKDKATKVRPLMLKRCYVITMDTYKLPLFSSVFGSCSRPYLTFHPLSLPHWLSRTALPHLSSMDTS